MRRDFSGRTAVVTGGARGIGREIARSLMEAGAAVAVIDRLPVEVPCAMKFQGDLADPSCLENFRRAFVEKLGKLDFLVNNACLTRGGLPGCGYDDFLYVFRVGAAAPYYLTKLFWDDFNPGASVVNISSTRASMSQPFTESYSAAKGAISALTHAMAVSLSGRARVNSVSPGWIEVGNSEHSDSDRRQHPVGRVGRPSDIASAAMYLLSDDASFITAQNITVDGGMAKNMIYHGDFGWKLE
ncbi:MAG: SDR family oxidoreductase [Clostridiales bacterium]|nr:SDR family oxidoreductase [Clostridiales bacterium]